MDPAGGLRQRMWGWTGLSSHLSLAEQHRRWGFGRVLYMRVKEREIIRQLEGLAQYLRCL